MLARYSCYCCRAIIMHERRECVWRFLLILKLYFVAFILSDVLCLGRKDSPIFILLLK